MAAPIPVAVAAGKTLSLLPSVANRHGLITGATGTGKTVTLQVLAEGFSRIGVPVFLADVKGDLAGLGMAGEATPKLTQRLAAHGLPAPKFEALPVVPWDVFGERGHPVRATVTDLGPLLLSRMLALNATQEAVLTLAFKVADDNGLLLLDFKDLRALLEWIGENAKTLRTGYGNVSPATIGTIQRGLLQLESEGGETFLGEPALDVADLLAVDGRGRGQINVLAAERLLGSPRLYATFLLWLLSELFERLPEIGDPDKPRLVFFFDEAHLLFDEAPKPLLEKVEQVVRLVRSKGVGVYFVTQNPSDVPGTVLGQLGNRVQHALRAFTPADQKAVRAAAQSLRPNPAIDAEQVISELAVGEALVSMLDAHGAPVPVERAWLLAPGSRIGPLSDVERGVLRESSPIGTKYDQAEDRESAYEKLNARAAESPPQQAGAEESRPLPPIAPRRTPEEKSFGEAASEVVFGRTGPRGGYHPGLADAFAKSAVRSVASSLGRELTRGVLGSLFGGRRR